MNIPVPWILWVIKLRLPWEVAPIFPRWFFANEETGLEGCALARFDKMQRTTSQKLVWGWWYTNRSCKSNKMIPTFFGLRTYMHDYACMAMWWFISLTWYCIGSIPSGCAWVLRLQPFALHLPFLRQVRYNTELEQAQRVLSARVEEASLQARHAALEADMSRRWVGSFWFGLCQESWS